jgi:hypothetical protein
LTKTGDSKIPLKKEAGVKKSKSWLIDRSR